MSERMMTGISGKDLRYTVPRGDSELAILRSTDFAANAGEFVGIVGPNGAGKTTLLRALAGFLPIQGEVRIHQAKISKPLKGYGSRERARIISYMHQDTGVPFAFTVREVVAMGRHPWQGRFSSPDCADDEKTVAAMRITACYELADRSVQRLSGGERQRAMLARAIAQDTPILLLDEPTSSLDIGHARHVFGLCRSLAEDGRCIAAVLHDLRQAAAACSRLYLMHDGGIVAQGKPEDVLTPENIEKAYQVSVHVFQNPAGQWDYYIKQ